mgnify:CR=1 FL=1
MLDGDEEGHVAHFLDTVAEGLVDQGAVGEQMEHRTLVLGSQLEQILLAAGRLTAGAHVPVDAQRLALGDDAVHILKAEVQAVAVLGSQQPLQCRLQAEVGSSSKIHGILQSYCLRSSMT